MVLPDDVPLPECVTYDDDLPRAEDGPLVAMGPEQAVEMLRAAFHLGQLNQLRQIEREQALQTYSTQDPKDVAPLENYEFHFHKAQIVEALLEGGFQAARLYCQQRQFDPEDTNELITQAEAFIVAASHEQAKNAKAMAVARYNKLFERLYTMRDYKGAAMVQRCIDRLEGLETPAGPLDLTSGLLSVMEQVAREDPKPLGQRQLPPVANGEKTVLEITETPTITVQHVVAHDNGSS